jgi:hypothetical protein
MHLELSLQATSVIFLKIPSIAHHSDSKTTEQIHISNRYRENVFKTMFTIYSITKYFLYIQRFSKITAIAYNNHNNFDNFVIQKQFEIILALKFGSHIG